MKQHQAAREEVDGLFVSVETLRYDRRLLKVPYGPLIDPASLKVHRKLCRNIPGALAIKHFCLLAYLSMELDAPGRRHPLIYYVLISGMDEALTAYLFSTW